MSENLSDVSPVSSPELDEISTESDDSVDGVTPIPLQDAGTSYEHLSRETPSLPRRDQTVTQGNSAAFAQPSTSMSSLGVASTSTITSLSGVPAVIPANIKIGDILVDYGSTFQVAECSRCPYCIAEKRRESATESQRPAQYLSSPPVAKTRSETPSNPPNVPENRPTITTPTIPDAGLSSASKPTSPSVGNLDLSKASDDQGSEAQSASNWIGSIGDISESDDEWNPNVVPQKTVEPKKTSKVKKPTAQVPPAAALATSSPAVQPKVRNPSSVVPSEVVPSTTRGILKPTRALEPHNPPTPGTPTPSDVLRRLLYGASTPTSRTPRHDTMPEETDSNADSPEKDERPSSESWSEDQSFQGSLNAGASASRSAAPKAYSERRYNSSRHCSREKQSQSVRREYGGSSRRSGRPTRWDNAGRSEHRREESRSPKRYHRDGGTSRRQRSERSDYRGSSRDRGSSRRASERSPYGSRRSSHRRRRSRSPSRSSRRYERSSRRSQRSESRSPGRHSSRRRREGYASSRRQQSSRREWDRDMERTSRRERRDHSSDYSPEASHRQSKRRVSSRRSDRRTPSTRKRVRTTRAGSEILDWSDYEADEDYVSVAALTIQNSRTRGSEFHPDDQDSSEIRKVKVELKHLGKDEEEEGNIIVSLPNIADSDSQRTVQRTYSKDSETIPPRRRSPTDNYNPSTPHHSMRPPPQASSTGPTFDRIQRAFGAFAFPGDTDDDTTSEISTTARNIPDETVECLVYSSIVKDRCITCYEPSHVVLECTYLSELRVRPSLKTLMEARRKKYFDENPEIRKAARLALRSLEQRPASRYQDMLGLSGNF